MCSNGPIQDIKASNSRFRYTIFRFSFRNQTENDAVCVPLGWLLITLCLQLQKHLTKEKWKKIIYTIMAESLKPSWWIPFVKDIQFTLAWWTENWPASAVIIQQILKQKWSVVVHWPLGIICDTMRQIASPYLTLSERESWASALFFFLTVCPWFCCAAMKWRRQIAF